MNKQKVFVSDLRQRMWQAIPNRCCCCNSTPAGGYEQLLLQLAKAPVLAA
jgi:hypothetical protein